MKAPLGEVGFEEEVPSWVLSLVGLPSEVSNQPKGSAFSVVMTAKTGHKRNRSEGHTRSQDRWKLHSGASGLGEAVQSLEKPATSETAKKSNSANPASAGSKASGAGSTYTRRIVSSDAVLFENRKPGDRKVPNSALSVETLNGQIVYEGTLAETLIKF